MVREILDNEVTYNKNRNLLTWLIQQKMKYWNISALWHKSFSKVPISKNSGKLLIFETLWIICNKIEKYRKWIWKGTLEKDLTFFSTEW